MDFKDRKEAGQKLAKLLIKKYGGKNTIIYGLPRGGVVTAHEVAKALSAPLDIIVTRKIGHPYQPEYAIAALSEKGFIVHDTDEIDSVDQAWLREEIQKQREEIHRRRQIYTKGKSLTPKGKIAIIVDDGIATGLTIQAAVADIKSLRPKKIVIAVPITLTQIEDKLQNEVDDIIILKNQTHFLTSISSFYSDFPQVTDDAVIALLRKNRP